MHFLWLKEFHFVSVMMAKRGKTDSSKGYHIIKKQLLLGTCYMPELVLKMEI
jgi:hypothetical protein